MNKQGVSVAESLAVIILTGIIIILLGNVIQFFARSSNTIHAEEELSANGLILERQLTQQITNFGPNYADFCTIGDLSCIELVLDYHFEWDPVNELMVMVDDVPDQIMRIEFSGGNLLIDSVIFPITNASVSNQSTFSIYKNGTTDSITLVIHLVLEGRHEAVEEFVITKVIEQT